MRILVVYTNRNRFLSPAPLGALLVTERLARDGHDTKLLDLMPVRNPERSLEEALRAQKPELVAFSIRNVDNQQMSGLDRPLEGVRALADVVRRESAAPLLIGGTAVTTFPAQIRHLIGADYAFAGDDVDLVARFVRSLAEGAADAAVPGLCREESGADRLNPPALRGYPGIRFTGWERVDLRAHRRQGFYDIAAVTHTGCPLRCSFCDSHRTFGAGYILRDPRRVVEELTELRRRHGAKSIWLVNSGINRPLAYGKEVCARIAEARLGLSLGTLIEPGEFDEEMAVLMARAGASGPMIFGTTLDDAVLERNQPFYRRADVERTAALCRRAGMDVMIGQMYGAPGETLRSIRESLEAAYRMRPAMMITGYGFRIQPQTPLREVAVREGLIREEDDGFTPSFYLAPGLTPAEVASTLRRFRWTHPGLVLRMAGFIARSVFRPRTGRS